MRFEAAAGPATAPETGRNRTDTVGKLPQARAPQAPPHLTRAPPAPHTVASSDFERFLLRADPPSFTLPHNFSLHHVVSRVRDEGCAMTLVHQPARGGCTQIVCFSLSEW